MSEPMMDSYVYKDAVTHSADNAVANPRDSATAPEGP